MGTVLIQTANVDPAKHDSFLFLTCVLHWAFPSGTAVMVALSQLPSGRQVLNHDKG